jgi:RND family efflux transporter MFP subunit
MRKRRTWFILIIVLLLAAGGIYVAYTRYFAVAEAVQEPTLQTATVYQGDIVLTADGSGNLLPASELELAFQASGVLAEVLVEVGDRVQAGDALARLDDTDARQAVADAEMQVAQAEINLALAQNETDAGLAQANLDAAQADYEKVVTLAAHTGDQLTSARINLEQAQTGLADAQGAYDTAWDPARDWELYDPRRATALENERDAAVRNLEKAQDSLQVAQANYNLAVIGIDDSAAQDAEIKVTNAQVSLANEPIQLQQSQLALGQAQLKLESAQRTLEQTILIAPVDGTVMDIAAAVGESVGAGPFITLADLETPLVRFWVEEMDMISVAAGNPVNVVFEALPDYVFPGEIVRVDPALVTVENTPAVQVWASVDLASQPVNLLSGMTAEVEIVAGEAKGALLVPAQALRELTPGQYAVFVVKPDGELEMRPVEVGLRDFVNAEILSGLELGDIVSTGMVEGSDSSNEPSTGGTEPPAPGVMRFLGGG